MEGEVVACPHAAGHVTESGEGKGSGRLAFADRCFTQELQGRGGDF